MRISARHGADIIGAFPVLLFLLLFVSCNSNNTANQGSNNTTSNIAESAPVNASDDAEELKKLIVFPSEPEEVLWLVETDAKNKSQAANKNAVLAAPDANAKRLIVVLKLSDENAQKLIDQAAAAGVGTDASIEPEPWFPPELIAQSETSGDQALKGKQYSARDFYQAPFTSGKLIKIEQPGYFVLELTTF